MKRTTIFIVLIVSATVCLNLKAIGQTNTGKKHARESASTPAHKVDSLNRVIQNQARMISEMGSKTPNDPELYRKAAQYEGVQEKLDGELYNEGQLRGEIETLKAEILEKPTGFVYKNNPIQKTPDLTWPLTSYTSCPADTACKKSIDDLLAEFPTEEEVAAGDAATLKKLHQFVEAIDRLDARTAASYYTTLMAQSYLMSKRGPDKKERREYHGRRAPIELTLFLVRKREQDILDNPDEWKKYGTTKKKVEAIFNKTNILELYRNSN